MRAEMQHGMRLEILPKPAVESGKRMRRREPLFEQQAHRIALVAEGGLNADEDIAELGAQDEDRSAIALMLAGSRPPLRCDLVKPGVAPHHLVGGNPDMDIGKRPETPAIALYD